MAIFYFDQTAARTKHLAISESAAVDSSFFLLIKYEQLTLSGQ